MTNKLRHEDFLIDKNDPFSTCNLGREKYAEILTNIIATYDEGFVLAINNEWGTGKTTFVKMWQQYLNNNNYRTLFFNAWENDFNSNPLTALMSELSKLTNESNKLLFKSLVKKGAVITKNVIPALIKALLDKHIDTEIIKEAIENTTKGAVDIFQEEIDEYSSKKKSLEDFKIKLHEFVGKITGNKPLVFIIDELDRCHPHYAVEVLEQIKHFFSVKGIVFILSIDKTQFGNAIRGFYGSDKINADEYLRRFIDLEYSMPNPDTELFCKYLYKYFHFSNFFEHSYRIKFNELKGDDNLLIKVSSKLFEHANLSLRQQEKIYAHARIVLNSFKPNFYIFPSLLVTFIFLKSYHKDLYESIKNLRVDINILLKKLKEFYPSDLEGETRNYFIHLEANLIYMYNNSLDRKKYHDLIQVDDKGVKFSLIQSEIDSTNNKFINFLDNFITNHSMDYTPLKYLINRIDFIEPTFTL